MPYKYSSDDRKRRIEKCRRKGLPCKRCGKQIVSAGTNPKFCSPRCCYDFRKESRPAKYCVVCGKEMGRWTFYRQRACSRACGWILERRRKEFLCKNCGSNIAAPVSRASQRFCNMTCRVSYIRKTGTKTCKGCGKEYYRPLKCRNHSFCSKECSKKYFRGSRSPLWRDGGRTSDRGSDWPETSEAARRRDKYTCQVCGKAQTRPKLSVDHIVPFRLTNANEPINLISLCPYPCHSRKTNAESKLLKGDVLGFKQRLNVLGWPMERVEAALGHWQHPEKQVQLGKIPSAG